MRSISDALIGQAYHVRVVHTVARNDRREYSMPSVAEVPCVIVYAVMEVDADLADWQADRLAATHQGGLRVFDSLPQAVASAEHSAAQREALAPNVPSHAA